jgi:hypothetical protein
MRGGSGKIIEIMRIKKITIEALYSNLRRIFDPQGIIMFPIRSLTPQQTTGNALAAGFNTRA